MAASQEFQFAAGNHSTVYVCAGVRACFLMPRGNLSLKNMLVLKKEWAEPSASFALSFRCDMAKPHMQGQGGYVGEP